MSEASGGTYSKNGDGAYNGAYRGYGGRADSGIDDGGWRQDAV